MSAMHPRPRNRSALARSFFACLAFTFAGGAMPTTAGAAPADDAKTPVLDILQLRHIAPAAAATLIRPALSDTARVALDERTSALVVSDFPENMDRVRAVLAAVDDKAADAAAAAPVAAAPNPAASTRPDVETDAALEAELEDALEHSGTYRAYRDKLVELDQALADQRFGSEHPRSLAARAKRDALQRRLDDVREEIRDRLVSTRAAALRGGASRVGLIVSRATPVVTRQLKLPWGSGLVVDQVHPTSAADAAGLMPYDVLHRLDGQLLVNAEQLDVLVGSLEAGKEVQLELYRDGENLKRTVKVPAK